MMDLFKSNLVKFFFVFLLLSLVIILGGYTLADKPPEPDVVNPLTLKDGLYIFLINFSLFVLLILFSFTGFSILFIFRFIFSMGDSGKVSGIDPLIYYSSSFIHGLGELIIAFIILSFSFWQFRLFFKLFKKEKEVGDLIEFYKNGVKYIIPIGFLLSVVNALSEVYISNRMILLLT
jgi:hypothetical protein